MTDLMSYPRESFEHFSLDRMYEGDRELLLMAFDEEDLVYMMSIAKSLLELSEMMGNPPPIEMAAMHSRFTEALNQFYGDEEECP